MSQENIRKGDTVISTSGEFYTVISHDFTSVKARKEQSNKQKTFKKEDLFCVDLDDGIWQETVN